MDKTRRLRYTPAETAFMLNITRPTLYRLLEAGKIRSHTTGRRRYFTERDILEFLEAEQERALENQVQS